MSLIGNILWFLLFGLEMGLAWIVTGLVFCCTIIGIPYGVASFRIAMFAFFPFGKDIVPSESFDEAISQLEEASGIEGVTVKLVLKNGNGEKILESEYK